jgi:hypothetical protein
MDIFLETKKKEYELKVIELLVGRTTPVEDLADVRKKRMIMEQAEVYYRDHIHGVTGTDASHHNIKQRFPDLNEKIRQELSTFAEQMHEAGDSLERIQAVINAFGVNLDFNAEKLKTLLKK